MSLSLVISHHVDNVLSMTGRLSHVLFTTGDTFPQESREFLTENSQKNVTRCCQSAIHMYRAKLYCSCGECSSYGSCSNTLVIPKKRLLMAENSEDSS